MRGEGVWNQTPFQVEQMVFSVVTADEDRGARRTRSAPAPSTRSSMLPWVPRGPPKFQRDAVVRAILSLGREMLLSHTSQRRNPML